MIGTIVDEDLGLISAPLAYVLAAADPFTGDPWGVGPLRPSDVRAAIEFSGPHPCTLVDLAGSCRECEINRVAHLALWGWPPAEVDPHPVVIDVGALDYVPVWPIVDGNHRVAAAVVRGDTHIEVMVTGDYDRAIAVLVDGADLWSLDWP